MGNPGGRLVRLFTLPRRLRSAFVAFVGDRELMPGLRSGGRRIVSRRDRVEQGLGAADCEVRFVHPSIEVGAGERLVFRRRERRIRRRPDRHFLRRVDGVFGRAARPTAPPPWPRPARRGGLGAERRELGQAPEPALGAPRHLDNDTLSGERLEQGGGCLEGDPKSVRERGGRDQRPPRPARRRRRSRGNPAFGRRRRRGRRASRSRSVVTAKARSPPPPPSPTGTAASRRQPPTARRRAAPAPRSAAGAGTGSRPRLRQNSAKAARSGGRARRPVSEIRAPDNPAALEKG